jgi:pimeloyl-ACP methyl ester carboxylesterase
MTRATAVPRVDRTISLRDGRQLAYAEWGDPLGRPVVLLHGRPGSRLFCPDEEATNAAGVRLVTIDRPGYGRSDPRPGRTLLGWADDYRELADHLGLPPSPVIGWSAGGRYALAQGFAAPDLVTAIGVSAGRGPIDKVPGAVDALVPEDRVILGLLARDPPAAIRAIAADDAWFEGDGWESMFRSSWGPTDDRVLAEPGTLEAMQGFVREGARQGAAGMITDDVVALTPWAFLAADIVQRVHLWWGEDDTDTDRLGLDYLAGAIPRVALLTYPGEGHLLPIDHWGEMLAAVS